MHTIVGLRVRIVRTSFRILVAALSMAALVMPLGAGERSYEELVKIVGEYVRAQGNTEVFAIVEKASEAQATITIHHHAKVMIFKFYTIIARDFIEQFCHRFHILVAQRWQRHSKARKELRIIAFTVCIVFNRRLSFTPI